MSDYIHWCGNCQIRIYYRRHYYKDIDWQDCPYTCEYATAMRNSYSTVDADPIGDYVKVVRCKNCKYCSVDKYTDGNAPNYVCIDMGCGVEADGFCAWGEKREDAEIN